MGIETLVAAFSPLIRLVGLVIPSVSKLFAQPKLYVILRSDITNQRAGVLSLKNDLTAPIISSNAIYHFDLTWVYNLKIRNNTGLNAYNLKLLNPVIDSKTILYPPIDNLKPILANTEIEYTLTIKESIEGTSRQSQVKMQNPPNIIQEQKVALEYTNEKGLKFYTVFTYEKSSSQNHFFSTYDFNLIKSYIIK